MNLSRLKLNSQKATNKKRPKPPREDSSKSKSKARQKWIPLAQLQYTNAPIMIAAGFIARLSHSTSTSRPNTMAEPKSSERPAQ